MILQKGKNTSLSFSPFQAYRTKDNKLRFSNGFIFNIFQDSQNKDGNELDVSLKESCNFCRPSNMKEDFSYQAGDKFYLSIDRNYIKSSKIIKVGASESLPTNYYGTKKDYILICAITGRNNDESNESLSINQILTQNVFIQDRSVATKKAFQVNQISTNVDETTGEIISKKYKMEGGFAVCLSSGKVLFVEGIDEFEVKGEKSLLEKEEPEKIIYLVAEYEALIRKASGYIPYDIITNATLTDAYLTVEGKERSRESIEKDAPKTQTKAPSNKIGKFYIPIYPLRPYGFNTQPREGNIYLQPFVERFLVLVSGPDDDGFVGPDGIEAFENRLYFIWFSPNYRGDFPWNEDQIVSAIVDGGGRDEFGAIDVSHELDTQSVLRLKV